MNKRIKTRTYLNSGIGASSTDLVEELDGIAREEAGLLSELLDAVDDLTGQALAAQLCVDVRVQHGQCAFGEGGLVAGVSLVLTDDLQIIV